MSTNTAALKNDTESKHFFFDQNLAIAITTGIQETLSEMCRLPSDFEGSFIAQNWTPAGQGSARIEMISGEQRAELQLHFADVSALTIMSKLLGRAPMQVNDETLDCLASLTSIVYGRVKAILNPLGYNFLMAIPEASYTGNLQPVRGDVSHLIIPFRVANAKCFIQVVFYA